MVMDDSWMGHQVSKIKLLSLVLKAIRRDQAYACFAFYSKYVNKGILND